MLLLRYHVYLCPTSPETLQGSLKVAFDGKPLSDRGIKASLALLVQ